MIVDSGEMVVTGVEVIVAAMAAGAVAGVGGASTAAVQDLYTALRDGLRRRLAGRGQVEQVLDAAETEPAVWQARLGRDLTDSGADRDEEILDAAIRLLKLVDPAGDRAGRYTVDLRTGTGAQVETSTQHVGTNYGAAAATMTGPVTINYGQPPVPPAAPGTA